VRAGAGLATSDGVKSYGVNMAVGAKSGTFASANIARAEYSDIDGSGTLVGIGAGYAADLDPAKTVQFCPQVSYTHQSGPDLDFGTGTIATLAHFLDARPEVGITGPKVMNRDGSLQSCGYWYPSLREEILLSRNVRKLGRLVLGQPRDLPPCDRASDVDWVDGCCLLIRREVVERIGLLDEQYFLYAEELDWCRSARKDGWIITTCPDARMIHLQGQSTQQVKATALALLVETKLRYYRKQDGVLTALTVGLVYALGCARRWTAEPEKSRAKLRGVTNWCRAVVTPRGRSSVVPRLASGPDAH